MALGFGARGKRSMKKKIKYTREPIGQVRIVEDFLPRPEDLVLKDDTVKVTLSLTKSSVDFFKSEARKRRTPYQAMIRRLVDMYAGEYDSRSH